MNLLNAAAPVCADCYGEIQKEEHMFSESRHLKHALIQSASRFHVCRVSASELRICVTNIACLRMYAYPQLHVHCTSLRLPLVRDSGRGASHSSITSDRDCLHAEHLNVTGPSGMYCTILGGQDLILHAVHSMLQVARTGQLKTTHAGAWNLGLRSVNHASALHFVPAGARHAAELSDGVFSSSAVSCVPGIRAGNLGMADRGERVF